MAEADRIQKYNWQNPRQPLLDAPPQPDSDKKKATKDGDESMTRRSTAYLVFIVRHEGANGPLGCSSRCILTLQQFPLTVHHSTLFPSAELQLSH